MSTNVLERPKRAPGSAMDNFVPQKSDPEIKQSHNDKQGSVKVPKEYEEPLARMVRNWFYEAKRVRATQRLGNTTVEETLNRCWRQVEGEIDPCLMETISSTGVDVSVNLTLTKVEAWESWVRSIIVDNEDMPWVNEPTPIADLSPWAKDEVLAEIKSEIFDSSTDISNVTERIRTLKAKQLKAENDYAKRASKNMARLMHDQAVEGGFKSAQLLSLRDMATYPYCVVLGPMPKVVPVTLWDRNGKIRFGEKLVMGAKRGSPFDLFWSSDSPDTQRGSYMVYRDRMTRANLIQAAKMQSYIKPNVLAALQQFSRSDTPRDWLNKNPEDKTNMIWQDHEQIEVLHAWGKFSAKELRPYGLEVEDGNFYEARVTVLGGYCIQVHINRNPSPFCRPVNTASMSKNGETIPGIGLAQKSYDIERAFNSALRGLIRNAHYSSGPIGEVDFERIQRWVPEDLLGVLEPYTMQPVDPDFSAGGRPAHYFHNSPNIASALINVMQYFSQLLDRVTSIPAAIHGEAVGTGVNRTYRGVTLLQGNALKGLQSGLTNYGRGIAEPFGKNLFYYNMRYSKDSSVKGDSQVRMRDLSALLEREVKKQATLETLQLVAQLANAQAAPRGALEYAANEALEAAGIPMEQLADNEAAPGAAPNPEPGASAIPSVEPGAPGSELPPQAAVNQI